VLQELHKLRDNVRASPLLPWEDNWSAIVWPHIRHGLNALNANDDDDEDKNK